jgi:hypothetical protein
MKMLSNIYSFTKVNVLGKAGVISVINYQAVCFNVAREYQKF